MSIRVRFTPSPTLVTRPRDSQPSKLWPHWSSNPSLPLTFQDETRAQSGNGFLLPASKASLRLELYVALLVLDVTAIALGFMTGNFLRFGRVLATPGLNYIMAFTPVFVALAFSIRAYTVEALEKPRTGAFRALKALAIAGCALLLALFYTKTSAAMSRAVFGLGLCVSAGLILAARHAIGATIGKRHNWKFINEILLVDGVTEPTNRANHVVFAEKAGLRPYVDDPLMAERIGRLFRNADRILLATSSASRARWVKTLKGIGIDVEVITPELDAIGALQLRRSDAGASVLVAPGPLCFRDRIVKRLFDIVVATVLLVLLSPFMVAIAAVIRLTSPGPALFRQTRIGFGNCAFQLLKFRTMRADASDSDGLRSASRGDDRLTAIGAFLRRTSMDELPQLLNVLKGEMSVVGPRPHARGSTAENNLFWDIDDRYWQRGAVKPGMTGLAQIRGYRGATNTRQDLTDRIQADLEYLANWTIWRDVAIILRTARVLMHPNAY